MNKELSPLEALHNLVERLAIKKYDENGNLIYWESTTDKECLVIESALKDYEMEHTLRIRLENINYELVREKEDNENKLKALEIIKQKEVDVGWLKRAKDLHEYNRGMGINSYSALTQEEFDLLKEVLL